MGGRVVDSLTTHTAARGNDLRCNGWRQEAILRMLENNLENAEDPERLIVYGGTGKAARDKDALRRIVESLTGLDSDETLLIQSGKPVGVFRTWSTAPRVLMANSNLVPHWSHWEHFNELEKKGLMMYGQMTAGSWCYIGTQGIIQGTYETFAAAAIKDFSGSLEGTITLTGGLGGMGGAQPLAVAMNGGVCIAVEVDPRRAERRLERGFIDRMTDDTEEAIGWAETAKAERRPLGIGLVGNCAEVLPRLVDEGFRPDLVTDQTSAHDAVNGYVPAGMSLDEAIALRERDPEAYETKAYESMARHMRAILAFKEAGAVAFDYGNNLRGQAKKAGVDDAFRVPGFVPEYIRDLFCEGRGPFRWLAVSGDERDIAKTDDLVCQMFADDERLVRWIRLAREKVPFEGLPARVCWLGYGERERFALAINRLVREGATGPIAITRDHLDCGSVASPYRETEGMKDGSDAVADWPLLNALANCAAGADSVQIHNGGGVGIGLSTHAGMVVVCDGTEETDARIERVFRTDPGIGVLRHADAGYEKAIQVATKMGLGLKAKEVMKHTR
ncbi:MAG: urocanate hydratase [Euryarchaeota archaeon]|nr:urocanate hydratase [Euryarchaeota archaeon]